MAEKTVVQVYLDIDTENGCWNCKHDQNGICEKNLTGTVNYAIGVSMCGLKDWCISEEYFEQINENKRFQFDWRTGRFKDTQSNHCATKNMRVLENQIHRAVQGYENRINRLEKENNNLYDENKELKALLIGMADGKGNVWCNGEVINLKKIFKGWRWWE